jgi:hypothetical protein
MPSSSLARYLNPWKFRREQEAERLAALRHRDGDNCARCRRPLRFDLPKGHDQGFAVERIVSCAEDALENFRLCHPRCNPSGVDHTGQVLARARIKNEAALFARARNKRAA